VGSDNSGSEEDTAAPIRPKKRRRSLQSSQSDDEKPKQIKTKKKKKTPKRTPRANRTPKPLELTEAKPTTPLSASSHSNKTPKQRSSAKKKASPDIRSFFKQTTAKDYFSQFKKPNFSNLKTQTAAVHNLQNQNTSKVVTESVSLLDEDKGNEMDSKDEPMHDVAPCAAQKVHSAAGDDVEMKDVGPPTKADAEIVGNKPLKRRKKTPSPKKSKSAAQTVTDSPAIHKFEKLSVNPPDCQVPSIQNNMDDHNGRSARSDSGANIANGHSNGNSNGNSNGDSNPNRHHNGTNGASNGSVSNPQSTAKSTGRKRKLNEISKDNQPQSEPPKKKTKWYPGKQRSDEPPMRGQIELPSGKPFCLSRKKFVITGTLRSLLRDECKDLIMEYGGKVTGSVSGVTNYLIAGSEAGESKLKKAKEKRVDVIDEEQLFEMIRTLPQKPPPKAKPSGRASKGGKGGRDSISSIAAARGAAAHTRPTASTSTSSSSSITSSSSTTPSVPPQRPSNGELFVDKYAPRCGADLVGNNASIQKLKKHLLNWDNIKNVAVKTTSTVKKGVLLSGNPGIGKTSAVRVVAQEMGFNVVELNASDARSQKRLREVVEESLNNRRMTDFFAAKKVNAKAVKKKKAATRNLIIMDEVDGMSSGDRGGLAELTKFIKKTKVPIVCICNDRNSQKMRSFRSWCLDLIFRKPTAQQIAHRLSRIAANEGFQMEMPAIHKLAESTNGDIRQMLHMLQFWSNDDSKKQISFRDVKDRMSNAGKDLTVGLWDVAPSFFRGGQSMLDLINNYFVDYSMIPLMVQESYLKLNRHQRTGGRNWSSGEMQAIAVAAQSIADGDLIEARVRQSQQYSALPYHAVLSSIKPGHYAQSVGRMSTMMQFPRWMANNSTRRKNLRLCTELSCNINAPTRSEVQKVTLTPTNITLDYLEILKIKLMAPLFARGKDGVEEVAEFMAMYNLTKDNWDSLMEMGVFAKKQRTLDGQTKAALTRYCGKHLNVQDMASGRKLTKAQINDMKVKRSESPESESEGEGEEEEGDITKDKRIKMKKPKGKGKGKATAKGKKKTKKKKGKR